MSDDVYSVRMRASDGERHISGGEELVAEKRIQPTVDRLLERALAHDRGDPGEVTVTVERLDRAVRTETALPVVTVTTETVAAARETARRLLRAAGVASTAVDCGVAALERDTATRGAALLDAATGDRLDPDPGRGVRCRYVGTTVEGREALSTAIDAAGLGDTQVADALQLATKVVTTPGVRAELCWSDDPDYRPGYVATPTAYYRFPALKPAGDDRGGRAYFLDPATDRTACSERLESEPVRLDGVATFSQEPPAAVPIDRE
jgi:6-carboxyhexanoate--CoA ligase